MTLTHSIQSYPQLHFINPNTGPDPQPDLPDSQYRLAVPYLQGYTNVTLVGYVSTLYGKRNVQDSLNDIDLYWRWHELSLANKDKGIGPMGLDGIFIDEVDCNGDNLEYFETLYRHIKGKVWKSDKPGQFNFFLFLTGTGYVVLNPGCTPRNDAYYNIADLVVVFEHFYHNFIRPPLDDPPFQYIRDMNPSDGLKLMLPQSSNSRPSFNFAVMIHDFLPSQSREVKLNKLKAVINDLVQIKRIRAIFITDLEIAKEDIYADWSSFWSEFIDMIAEANGISQYIK